jgi:hypothetical protein
VCADVCHQGGILAQLPGDYRRRLGRFLAHAAQG